MTQPLLACGPYFEPSGLIASFAIFLLFKPLSYYAFVRAFRYRVCRAIPMTTRQAIGLAALRAGLGLVLVGGGAWALTFWEQLPSGFYIWVYMYAARLFAWWIVGKVAGLRGWRMIGWILAGESINVAFDLAVMFGLAKGALVPAVAVSAIAAFIYWIERRGRRSELTAMFTEPHCRVCKYNLTGNLSGICPECGTPVPGAEAIQASFA